MIRTAVALTHISAYSAHKNLGARKIMEAMRTANGTRSLHVSNKTWRKRSRNLREYVKRKRALLVKNIIFRWIIWWTYWVKVLFMCGIRFSISFHWYAFLNFCTQVSHPLAYGVRISSKASAAADYSTNSHYLARTFLLTGLGENGEFLRWARNMNMVRCASVSNPSGSGPVRKDENLEFLLAQALCQRIRMSSRFQVR